MKKLLTLILLSCLILTPIVFMSGCLFNATPDRSADQIFTKYSEIKNGEDTRQFFASSGASIPTHMQVTYTSANVNNNRNNSQSPVYLLFHIYEPMLESASRLFVQKAEHLSFRDIINGFSKETRARIYSALEEVDTQFKSFAFEKKAFDNSNNSASPLLEGLVFSYNKMLSAVLELNIAYAEGYYETVMSKRDFTSTTVPLVINDVSDMINYSKLLMTDTIHRIYTNNITLQNPPSAITAWLYTGNWGRYMTPYLTEIKRTSQGNTLEMNRSDITQIIQTLRETNNTYIQGRQAYTESLKDFDYKDYYNKSITRNETASTVFDQYGAQEKASYEFAQSFLSTQHTARLGAIKELITLFA